MAASAAGVWRTGCNRPVAGGLRVTDKWPVAAAGHAWRPTGVRWEDEWWLAGGSGVPVAGRLVAGRLPLAGGPWRRRRCGSDRPLAMQGDRPASGGQISGGWHVAATGSWPAGRWRAAAQGDRHSDAPGCRRVCMRIIKIGSDFLFFPKVGRCIKIFKTAHPVHDAVRMRIKTLKPNTMRGTQCSAWSDRAHMVIKVYNVRRYAIFTHRASNCAHMWQVGSTRPRRVREFISKITYYI